MFESLPTNPDRIRHLIVGKSHQVDFASPHRRCKLGHANGSNVTTETSMANLETSEFPPEIWPRQKIRVQARSLDSMLAGNEVSPPSLLEIDVESAELAVLQGGLVHYERIDPRFLR